MKFLFDHNLSPRLVKQLSDIAKDSAHVYDLGMAEAEDTEVWNYAKAQVLNPAIKLYIFRRGTTRLSQWTKFHSCRIKICIYRNLSANLLPYIRGTFNSCNIK